MKKLLILIFLIPVFASAQLDVKIGDTAYTRLHVHRLLLHKYSHDILSNDTLPAGFIRGNLIRYNYNFVKYQEFLDSLSGITTIDTSNKWVNTITRTPGKDSIIFFIGGTRYAIKDSTGGKPSLNKGVFVASPTSADTIDVWQTPVAITITSLKAVLRGTSPSVTYNIAFGTNIQSPTAVFTADITCTSITTGCSNSSGFNDATIPAGSFIWVYTTAASGTIRSIAFTINYTED
jgi:hypothetical protein